MSNWKFHRMTRIDPDGSEHRVDTYPIGPVKPQKEYECKYCHEKHFDWHQMDDKDYSEDVILCGNCGQTNLKQLADGSTTWKELTDPDFSDYFKMP